MKQIPYYERDVDFDDLAKQDPDFAKISQVGKRNGFVNFQDPKIVQQLTKSLLKTTFSLSISLPDDRLCPPVPVRWNYIRWIQELLDTTNPSYSDHYDPEREVLGLDIGVGASCIYALLACSTRKNWRMAGTDIDAHSLECAKANVEANDLEDRIRLKQVKDEEDLIPTNLGEMDFVMTNPPFYSSQEDFHSAYNSDSKDKTPSAVTSGANNEMICPGGDVGFVLRILQQSLILRTKIQWYTAMLSKLSSLQQIITKLKEHGITNYAVTSLHPGHRTKRWAVGWSFGDLRPRNDVARHGELVSSVLPPPTAKTIAVPMQSAKWSGGKVDETMKGLDVTWVWRPVLDAGVMQCRENVWSRAARRKKKFQGESAEKGEDEKMEGESGEEEQVALGVKISCKEEEVEVRWLRGQDFLILESFCGMLKRALSGQRS